MSGRSAMYQSNEPNSSVLQLSRITQRWLLQQVVPGGHRTLLRHYPGSIPAHEILWRASAEYPGQLVYIAASA
ncbi:MAG: hypothetical protein IT303_17855 [Dehalococcoidia bacterium]|nr:hypothetical protein [Dehalococcoidia bacterium]